MAGKRQPGFVSVHDAWMYALSSPDGTVYGELEELARLAAQIDEWRRPLAVSATSPVRLCFRLEEPEKQVAPVPQPEGVWFVHYLLQARDDPSLLIPVQQVWKGGRKRITALGGDTARLLAGEMPENIEEAFQSVGLSLFPNRRADLKTDCSCPDWSNPCKHIAAVYYLVGEEFDRDPFLMFKLRGMEREQPVALVSGQRSRKGGSGGRVATRAPRVDSVEASASGPELLASESRAFWGEPRDVDPGGADVRIPAVSAALPRRLGNFPFWRGEEGFLASLEVIYRQASPIGVRIFLGDSGEE